MRVKRFNVLYILHLNKLYVSRSSQKSLATPELQGKPELLKLSALLGLALTPRSSQILAECGVPRKIASTHNRESCRRKGRPDGACQKAQGGA